MERPSKGLKRRYAAGMSDLVNLQSADGVLTLSLHRPDARNALSLDLINALESTLQRVAADAAARVLVLRGEGKAFCAGMDLRGVLHDAERMGLMLHTLARVSLSLLPFNKWTLSGSTAAAALAALQRTFVCSWSTASGARMCPVCAWTRFASPTPSARWSTATATSTFAWAIWR
jgi:enoyl-CoA hydratase/carnithine racemase